MLAALMIEPIALYVGGWGLLGPAYGRTQDLVLGIVIMLAPILITALCVFISVRLMRRGFSLAPVVAGVPLVLAVAAYLISPFGPSG
ncbi:MAG: hypothetical protein BGP07_01720 [Rhizobiales bacterium 63-22]|nr:MAG: hypothetical protein BGP07_01720 [Rhizobiales bacterium 63-22]